MSPVEARKAAARYQLDAPSNYWSAKDKKLIELTGG